jgi:hypothetical protein
MKRLGLWIVGIVLLAIAGIAISGYVQKKQEAKAQTEASKERLQKAEALFAERCKTVGEKIHRTVEDVEGIYLLKLRPQGINRGAQFEMDDPYGRDLGGDGYIQSFTRGFFQANTKGTPAPGSPPRIGYLYVEAVDPVDGKRYRYTGGVKAVGKKDITAPNVKLELDRNPQYDINIYAFVMDKVAAPGDPPRYGVTYDDISTREEREYWIAGSSLKVIDLQTNEVIAERVGYMVDRAQGNTGGGRAPWLLATNNACPSFQRNPNLPLKAGHGASAQQMQTLDFVEKVLHPKVEK